jgi:hypothetical protein
MMGPQKNKSRGLDAQNAATKTHPPPNWNFACVLTVAIRGANTELHYFIQEL